MLYTCELPHEDSDLHTKSHILGGRTNTVYLDWVQSCVLSQYVQGFVDLLELTSICGDKTCLSHLPI